LDVETWLGLSAGDAAREQVRAMQRRAFEVQAGDTGEFALPSVEVDLAAITARCLVVVSGGQDVSDFRRIAADLPHVVQGGGMLSCRGLGICPAWNGRLRSRP